MSPGRKESPGVTSGRLAAARRSASHPTKARASKTTMKILRKVAMAISAFLDVRMGGAQQWCLECGLLAIPRTIRELTFVTAKRNTSPASERLMMTAWAVASVPLVIAVRACRAPLLNTRKTERTAAGTRLDCYCGRVKAIISVRAGPQLRGAKCSRPWNFPPRVRYCAAVFIGRSDYLRFLPSS